jgi:hypothetical protein
MPDEMGEVRLEVEGVEVFLDTVWVHHQNDPYPGGLRYRLLVPTAMAAQWVGERLDRKNEGIDVHWAREVLFLIAGMLSWVRHKTAREGHISAELTHVLNTIETVEESESHFQFGGVCSLFRGPTIIGTETYGKPFGSP